MQLTAQNYTLLPQGEADPLQPSPSSFANRRKQWNRRRIWTWAIPITLAVIFTLALVGSQLKGRSRDRGKPWPVPITGKAACPQFPALKILDSLAELEKEVRDTIGSDEFFDKSLKRMQGAVRIPTESFDDMGPVGEDPRWDVFKEFHAYLEESFPLVYEKLEFTPINTYGILLEWKGKDESLKPYLFMAHQDVVPVLKVTESRWKYPPYSAHYDGRFIWGRGATDCKNNLIGVLEAFETLLEKGFTPERTILAGFGFDEEISGPQGARFISKHLEDTKGKDSIDLIIDEGGLGIKEINGATFALPGLGEKGYFDVKVTVETEGGHSSVPPDHTGVGILSKIISAIEGHPYEPELTPVNPYFTTLQCEAEYGPDMNPDLRSKIKGALTNKRDAKAVADGLSETDIFQRYLMQTSQATDLISGGVKINALPEKVYAVINHRIAVESRVKDIQSNLESLISSKILKKFPMKLNAWGSVSGNTSTSSLGTITLETFGNDEPLEPSPVSPFDTDAYKIFTGTIKQVMGEDVIVAPSLMTGNTDTKFYWGLSRNIYRFSPVREGGRANAHTVDERVGMKEHVEGVRFFAQLIMNSGL